ncbi:glycosyltransferase family 4 protein [Aureibacillus halotolerans]|uniref:Glycosyltransferase involved in cell wall biosynthesis n=1 Tax=Aureibacillus halotolerans TaxID=1508390 RepID=A0A4R6TXR3_9BACI|nr:glycosyltransferase family 4 protein [Aureibacillus halotolerans]TDQ38680.1 glycosyltransferase involved in cell wall biosynthesis [Aureibacillus halotolerans]
MNILYVTPMWSGLKDLILEGKTEPRGMPAFLRPLKRLRDEGHQVTLLVGTPTPEQPLVISVPWLVKEDVICVKWQANGTQKLLSPWRMYQAVRQQLKLKSYDFVYGHGSLSVVGNLAANHANVPCGMRLYGTFLADKATGGPATQVRKQHPLEYYAYRLPKKFMLMTNDGTRGNHVYEALCPKQTEPPYRFHFWLNGVEPTKSEGRKTAEDQPFLFFPARLARWKQQHLAVELLHELHEKGHKTLRLQFAGHIQDHAYWKEIQARAKQLGLERYVTHIGTRPAQEMAQLYNDAFAVLSLYQVSNLGNVSIEALANGALVAALKDGSLDEVIVDGENGLLFSDTKEGADKLAALLADPSATARIREEALRRAGTSFDSWSERITREMDLIEAAVQT